MQHTQTGATNSGLEATMANTIESRDILSLGPLLSFPDSTTPIVLPEGNAVSTPKVRDAKTGG